MPSTLDPAKLLHTIDAILNAWTPTNSSKDRRQREALVRLRERIGAGEDPWDASQAVLRQVYPLRLVTP